MGETPSIGPAPTILAGVKEVVKLSLLANFRKGPSIFARIMTVFVKFEDIIPSEKLWDIIKSVEVIEVQSTNFSSKFLKILF